MDGLKLSKWKENFEAGLKALQIEVEAYMLPKKLDEFYCLRADEENQMLVLEIFNHDGLPKEIEDRIIGIYEYFKPEDSV